MTTNWHVIVETLANRCNSELKLLNFEEIKLKSLSTVSKSSYSVDLTKY